ncbi:MAG: hypothetical protein ACI8PP_002661, partial [Candidatus Pseudothioglobus sp.]
MKCSRVPFQYCELMTAHCPIQGRQQAAHSVIGVYRAATAVRPWRTTVDGTCLIMMMFCQGHA